MNRSLVAMSRHQHLASCSGRVANISLVLVVTCLLGLPLQTGLVQAEDGGVSFNQDVRPILSDNCFHCHGPDEDSRQADLRIDVRDVAIALGAIVPEDLENSSLIERIYSDDVDLKMPPPSSNKALSSAQKATISKWIASGAKYDSHWSLTPLPRKVVVPQTDSNWPRSEIDRFILDKLHAASMSPNTEADRHAWLRRVTFDLTGLPPTAEEIAEFTVDHSDKAYERVVDRLLASTAYGERMASEWLDVARYSDSFGYQRDDERFVWPWRDWVIQSFQQNKPYNEFVTWQLAGDLLPNATTEQKLATVFCRLHSHKKEGGVAVEEFRVENVADRTHTFASAFLGLTVECARCHDHKFDPITAKDYYRLTSYFANIDERGLISYFTDATPTPAMPLASTEQEDLLAEASKKVQLAEEILLKVVSSAEPRFESWLEELGKSPLNVRAEAARITFDHQVKNPPQELLHDEDTGFVEVQKKKLDPARVLAFRNEVNEQFPAISDTANRIVAGVTGRAVELTGDESVVIPGVGHIERHQSLTVSLWIRPSEVEERGVIVRRSGGWDDAGSMGYALVKRGARLRANLVHFWPGNAICIETDDILQTNEWCHVTLTYDGSSKAKGLRIYLNGKDADARIVKDHLTRTVTGWRGGYTDLAIGSRYRDRGFKGGRVDDVRVYHHALTPVEVRHAFDSQELIRLKDLAGVGELSVAEKSELREYYLAAVDEMVNAAQLKLQTARQRWNSVMDDIPAISIMREQPEPRPAYLLERGGYDSHGERLQAGTPEVFPSMSKDLPSNRLGLARWLFEPDHPLTARVVVNRYWQMLFVEGLVRTPEDFGSQGTPPTHPELLDWLARDFVDHGWDVKRLMRILVLSSTYRQSSVTDAAVRQLDPENRLLSRWPSKQLSAEMIRDNALAVSGLLIDQIGGPPVKPYDLPLAYNPLDADVGQGLYRRSLYTFWKRTSPSPVMMTMNANRREVCMLKREITSSPLQALVLLNGKQFIEASRVLAEKLIVEKGEDVNQLVTSAFIALTSREPTEQEAEVLRDAYREQLEEFRSYPQLAEELLQVGRAPSSGEIPLASHAAATVLVNAIMNLDESLICR